MNRHALAVLEFPAVLALLAQRASSTLAADRVLTLEPRTDPEWIAQELARVAAMRELARADPAIRPEPIPDVRAPLARLRAAGAAFSGAELLDVATLLRSSRLTHDALLDDRLSPSALVLRPLAQRLLVAHREEAAVARAIDSDGTVRDEASPVLRHIRRELRGAGAEVVRMLERFMARLDPHHRVPDMSVTLRNGRYVVPVRREARAVVGGIVHGESATRGTLFVEPPAAIEAGNRMEELQADEVREVERILGELTDALRPLRDGLSDALEVLIVLDMLHARARFADDFHCAAPALALPAEGFVLRDARHPLLLASGGTVVPFTLDMTGTARTLLLSGPNTGGKTVLLKAVGLIAVMTQSGIPAPVGPESRVAIFDECFADIGDEQSIAASLSTFSAHVHNLGDVLARATANSLVLIDELGSGTDPAEGAALGGAILEELTRRGTITVATTHLGALKLLAVQQTGIVNGSLQFDEAALEPTYRLRTGIPGRSYGLSIARRLRLPGHVLQRAEERVSREERDVAVLLAELERREQALAERDRELASSEAASHERAARLAVRETKLRDAERELERRSRQEARQYLLEARQEVERAIRGTRERGATADAARAARRRVEELATEQASALDALARAAPATGDVAAEVAALAPGATVAVRALGGRTAQLLELRGADALIAMGSFRLSVPVQDLSPVPASAPPPEPVPLRGTLPEEHAISEIDVRGLRVDEMEQVVMQALDAAIRSDMPALRIIHGKGTGALRARVAELLRGDARVRSQRMGAWNEGGAGVTIAQIR